MSEKAQPECRSCGAALSTDFADLGSTPISNAFRRKEQLSQPEPFYPLRAFVCDRCKLVQLEDFATAETHFHGDYVYFSSFSDTWVAHARSYADAMTNRFSLGPKSFVAEVASNDGYLLQYFVAKKIPSLGIDPAKNCADAAREKYGVETHVAFFNRETAARIMRERGQSDLIAANNVLAHVPDLNAFVAGFPILLKPNGVATFEFPHLLNLMREHQFDTIYHEHYSYLSYLALKPLFARHGLRVFDAEKLPTHGGSLRLFVAHADSGHAPHASVAAFEAEERDAGLDRIASYAEFADEVAHTKRELVALLTALKSRGATIAGYGAPAKGNTLLNYCGIGTGILDFTVDRAPSKQGLYLPGTLIPVLAPSAIPESKPDYLLILPWNLKDEIMGQMAQIRDWGGKFIVPIPKPVVLD